MKKLKPIKLKKYWSEEVWENRYLMLLSIFFLAVALFLSYLTGTYVRGIEGVMAPDLILDNIPAINLRFIYIYGIVLVVAALFFYPLFFKVSELHSVISHFSLLILIRGIFTSFTHLVPPEGAIPLYVPSFLFFLDFTNDLFFSGHTAVPFLGFLLFKKTKIRYFFLISSIIMASVVLLMHVHYTIDVFSAFFITYGSYKIGDRLFRKINSYFKKKLG